MPKTRVIFLNRVYWPASAATAQLLTDLAEGLVRRGWNVQVIATGDSSEIRRGVTIHRTGVGQKHDGVISQAFNYWRFIRRARTHLSRVVQPGDIVVAMTDPPLLGAAVATVAQNKGARVIHWIQDIYPEILTVHLGALAAWPLLPLRLKRDRAWRSAHRCVVLGDAMARTVASQGVGAAHLAIVSNWAPRELQTPASGAACAQQRAAWGLTGKFIAVYSGNLGRVHEFNALLVAAEVLQSQPEFVFLFIGTGARLAEMKAVALKKQLRNIRFFPMEPRENLAVSLAAADVHFVTLRPDFASLVYPSKLAGILAAARPVIFVGPTSGEIAGFLQARNCGVSVGSECGADIATVLRLWQANPQLPLQLGRNSRMAYEEHFAFDLALNHWEDVLRQTAAKA